jgi:hypothetical protein
MKNTEQLKLHFPLDRISEPILTRLVTEFDIEPNLVRADVDAANGGWIVLRVTGEPETLASARIWIEAKGITVSEAE